MRSELMVYARKLQKIGESLYVSLPKNWIGKEKLGKGDTIMLFDRLDGSLTLHPEVEPGTTKSVVLNVGVDESPTVLRRRITGAYVDGFDIIQLKARQQFTDEQQEAIRKITGFLFGLEIVELSSSTITFQCLLTKTLSIDNMIQRIHGVMKSMFSETISGSKERNTQAVRSVIDRTSDVKRLSLVVHRLLRSAVLFPTKQTLQTRLIDIVDYLRVIDKITEASGSIKRIAESTSALKHTSSSSVLKPLLATSVKVLNIYDEAVQALMTEDLSLANHALDEELETSFNNLLELIFRENEKAKMHGKTFPHMYRIVDNLKQMYLYAREMAEIAVDRAEQIPENQS
ncbi:MAG: hypothetical protein NWF14_04500 [Candidatus Bathyarchaeota archaeon]|nr:hypothetical protein [Candidatus Bathyarchaeota archaeon]